MIAFDQETCGDFDMAISKEWLETNGLGGFASSTLLNHNTRRYHGLLTAATRPPLGRHLLVNALDESCYGPNGEQVPVTHEHVIGFRLDPWPIWTYRVGALLYEKSVAMIHGQNTTVVRYRVRKESPGVQLRVRPRLTSRDFHSLHRENPVLNAEPELRDGLAVLEPYPGTPALYLHHNASRVEPGLEWTRSVSYLREKERGLDWQEDLWSPMAFVYPLEAERPAYLTLTIEGDAFLDADLLLRQESERRQLLLKGWESTDDVTHHLVLAADQFIVKRSAGEDEKTVIAGYPWFEDWGRDTFIALPGLLLATGRYDDARKILKSYAGYADHGMIPNRFPDATGYPEYNTVDASLWYIVAVFHYLRYTRDFDFVRTELWPALTDILLHYQNGTRYQIHMDVDGLIYAGQAGVQLTWMDAKIGDWVVTPRAGKPVEIQALWYNALRIMDQIGQMIGQKEAARRWAGLAEKVWGSINRQFWNEATGGLFDCVDGEERDAAIRPNMIFAVSLPFECVTPDRAAQIVGLIEERLLTPFGLRTLDPLDSRYVGRCEGDVRARDSAYHQGTVWPWLIGPFLTAYQKVHGKSPKIQAQLRAHLALLLTHLWENGLGTIAEIFDGDMPHDPRGCIAQAWSVAEILRLLREELGPVPTAPMRLSDKKSPLLQR